LDGTNTLWIKEKVLMTKSSPSKTSAFEESDILELKIDMKQHLSTIEGYLVPKKVYNIEEPHKEEAKEN
jgi:hypothetical protein